jgi:hypothetical protein
MDFYYRKTSPAFLKSLEGASSIHGLENIQNYLPLYTNFLNMTEKNYNSVGLNSRYELVSVVLPETSSSETDDEYDPRFIDVEVADSTKPTAPTEVKGVFVKYSPLIDPIRYLSGKYSNVDNAVLMALPKYGEHVDDDVTATLPKVNDVNNSAYVDGFFTYLSSKVMHAHNFVHGLEYYGAFVAHKRQFEVDISDDVEYFSECSFFNANLGKLFHMDEYSFNQMSLQTGMYQGNHSDRAYKPKLQIQNQAQVQDDTSLCVERVDDTVLIQFDTLDEAGLNTLFTESPPASTAVHEHETETVYEGKIKEINKESDVDADTTDDDDDDDIGSASSHDSRTSNTSSHIEDPEHKHEDKDEEELDDDDCSIEDEHEDEYDDEEEDDGVYVDIEKFPVNAIVMEECEDTLDALIENDEITSVEQWSSILMQVIMTLIAYQKMFWFTHNDLHTNNIMFVETKKEYLYYAYNGKHYKVPTFGKIFKVIDFGRSVYRFKNLTMCSDSFHSSGDAATQYNFPPYMNPKKPLLEPNFSFDLCRLACSMFDYFIPTHDVKINLKSEHVRKLIASNPIIALVNEWVSDDKGRNVLYKSSGKERYPDFKLYKMIARTVHAHIPAKQLENPLFSKYEVKRSALSQNAKHHVMNIDDLPEYYLRD